MAQSIAADDFEHLEDVLGQLTALKTYTHMVLAFPCDVKVDDVSRDLQLAAAQLLRAFPFLAGHVIRKGKGPGKSGNANVVPYSTGERSSPVILKNCHYLCSPMKTILQAGAPMDMLDGEFLARRKGPPHTHDESQEPAPVLEIQANLIQGGLLLVFQGHHNLMDMNGMGQIIRLYAKALRKEPFSEVELEQGNRDRRMLISLLDAASDLGDMSRFTPRAAPNDPVALESRVAAYETCWVYFHFSAENLATLKAAASKVTNESLGEKSVSWITTDDALSAFLAQKITHARLKRMPKVHKATFCRAIDARRFMDPPIPKGYLGHAVTCAYTEVALEDSAATSDLPELAKRMRADLLETTPLQIRRFATKLNSMDDKSMLSYGARMDLAGFDLTISSWSGLGLCRESFGEVLGKPVFAKRPKMSPIEGLLYLMPKTFEGDVDVAICARVEDINSLRSDEGFTAYGKYVGYTNSRDTIYSA